MDSLTEAKIEDSDLKEKIKTALTSGDYIFKNHARDRLQERTENWGVDEYKIVRSFKNLGTNINREPIKDEWDIEKQEWCYSFIFIANGERIRVVLAFDKNEKLLKFITVVHPI